MFEIIPICIREILVGFKSTLTSRKADIMLIKLFSGARATGHVFYLKNGRVSDKGLAYRGLIGPKTTVAVVPTTPQILDFSVEARTQDKQSLTVTGDLKITLSPKTAVAKFDFTVDPKQGSYLSQWEQTLRAIVIEHVLGPIHTKAKELDVETAMLAHEAFANAVQTSLNGSDKPLSEKGIVVESCSVASIEADDEEITEAIGSKERQEMLAESDKAMHARRLKASANDRAVKRYEAATVLNLETDRAKLIDEQSKNKQKEAEADAEATKTRLVPFTEADAGKVLGAALMKMAESGRIANLSIVPEMLAALGQK